LFLPFPPLLLLIWESIAHVLFLTTIEKEWYGRVGMVIPFGIPTIRLRVSKPLLDSQVPELLFFENFPVVKPTRKEDCPMSAP